MPTFETRADSLVRKLSAKHGPLSECERHDCCRVTYTFESGVSVTVWQARGGPLQHKVHDER